jgi:hypothetical protein
MKLGTRKVDDDTGQIYYETAVKARSMVPKWIWRTRGRPVNPSEYKSTGLGASSLRSMAMRSVGWNMTRIDHISLKYLPGHIAKELADYITSW